MKELSSQRKHELFDLDYGKKSSYFFPRRQHKLRANVLKLTDQFTILPRRQRVEEYSRFIIYPNDSTDY